MGCMRSQCSMVATPMNCNRNFIMHPSRWSLANWSFSCVNIDGRETKLRHES